MYQCYIFAGSHMNTCIWKKMFLTSQIYYMMIMIMMIMIHDDYDDHDTWRWLDLIMIPTIMIPLWYSKKEWFLIIWHLVSRNWSNYDIFVLFLFLIIMQTSPPAQHYFICVICEMYWTISLHIWFVVLSRTKTLENETVIMYWY